MREFLLAIDPGTTESGICLLRTDNYKPVAFDKIDNNKFEDWVLNTIVSNGIKSTTIDAVIERMQGRYNGGVGAETFISCEWIGYFRRILEGFGIHVSYILRSEEYKALCGKLYTHNDVGVRQSLVDMFAYGQPNFGKGNKQNPGWFYGFKADVWSSYAQGVAHILRERKEVR